MEISVTSMCKGNGKNHFPNFSLSIKSWQNYFSDANVWLESCVNFISYFPGELPHSHTYKFQNKWTINSTSTPILIFCISKSIRDNSYHLMKWTWQPKIKHWTRQFVFHFAVMPLGKAWIHLFCPRLWANRRTDWALLVLIW